MRFWLGSGRPIHTYPLTAACASAIRFMPFASASPTQTPRPTMTSRPSAIQSAKENQPSLAGGCESGVLFFVSSSMNVGT
jgi:hypothetical protein